MRKLAYLGVALIALALSAYGYSQFLQITGNVHTVVEGELYRAAQVDPKRIRELHEKDGIRSILNLRGPDPGEAWYDNELRTSEELGITHANFPMKSSRELTRTDIETLVSLMRDLPKPLLIHCEHGADRTGLAAAIYVGMIKGAGEEAAEMQLSPIYGHFALPYVSRTYAMDESWETVESVLGFDS
ncbi:tyrosine-protein phosphatase [Tabrizicola sp. J26]|uniref:tyrosine-protein phosphatase n=1 Tax=Alitabrizicola rongguiensis TaxID=2909234 RepID=UPI001F2930B0|nr:tyrosine-protein phosphatase [Tabrizicola rongguiensis]MCF1708986.1 tyrosine-protein phosphatase [Tabrizicola rongguiensis]